MRSVRIPQMLDHSRDDAARDHRLSKADLVGDEKLPHGIARSVEPVEHIVDGPPLKGLQRGERRVGAEAFIRHEWASCVFEGDPESVPQGRGTRPGSGSVRQPSAGLQARDQPFDGAELIAAPAKGPHHLFEDRRVVVRRRATRHCLSHPAPPARRRRDRRVRRAAAGDSGRRRPCCRSPSVGWRRCALRAAHR